MRKCKKMGAIILVLVLLLSLCAPLAGAAKEVERPVAAVLQSAKVVSGGRVQIQVKNGAEGSKYAVYCSSSATGGFKEIADGYYSDDKSGITTLVTGPLEAGRTYYFKARSYLRRVVEGSAPPYTFYNYYGPYSKTVSVKMPAQGMQAGKIASASYNAEGKVKLRWAQDAAASGYAVYMKTAIMRDYALMALVQGKNTTEFVSEPLLRGVTYSFAIAPYKTLGGENVYGTRSAPRRLSLAQGMRFSTEKDWLGTYKNVVGDTLLAERDEEYLPEYTYTLMVGAEKTIFANIAYNVPVLNGYRVTIMDVAPGADAKVTVIAAYGKYVYLDQKYMRPHGAQLYLLAE